MSENFRGGSLVDWRIALQPVHPALAEQLHEDADPYKAVEQLGLPVPLYCAFDSVAPFLNNSFDCLNSLKKRGVEKFYVGLRSKDSTLPKYREFGLADDEIAPYIRDHVEPNNQDKYFLRIAEYAPAQYGATMIVNPSGSLRVEIVRGEMANLATGVQTPEFTVWSDQFTGVMRYSFDDLDLRDKIWRAIKAIPTIDDGSFRPPRLPGYYEFSLIRRGNRLVPVFFDYKTNPIFTIPE